MKKLKIINLIVLFALSISAIPIYAVGNCTEDDNKNTNSQNTPKNNGSPKNEASVKKTGQEKTQNFKSNSSKRANNGQQGKNNAAKKDSTPQIAAVTAGSICLIPLLPQVTVFFHRLSFNTSNFFRKINQKILNIFRKKSVEPVYSNKLNKKKVIIISGAAALSAIILFILLNPNNPDGGGGSGFNNDNPDDGGGPSKLLISFAKKSLNQGKYFTNKAFSPVGNLFSRFKKSKNTNNYNNYYKTAKTTAHVPDSYNNFDNPSKVTPTFVAPECEVKKTTESYEFYSNTKDNISNKIKQETDEKYDGKKDSDLKNQTEDILKQNFYDKITKSNINDIKDSFNQKEEWDIDSVPTDSSVFHISQKNTKKSDTIESKTDNFIYKPSLFDKDTKEEITREESNEQFKETEQINSKQENKKEELSKEEEEEILQEITEPELHKAIKEGNFDIVQKLLNDQNTNINRKNPDGDTPLHLICKTGKLDKVKNFFPDDQTQENNNKYRINLNIKNDNGDTPLTQICSDLEEELSIKPNNDINSTDENGLTKILRIAEFQLPEIGKFIIQKGALSTIPGKSGKLPNISILDITKTKRLEILFTHGADLNKRGIFCGNKLLNALNSKNLYLIGNVDSTPLCIFCEINDIESVKFLLNHNVDINFQDGVGKSPLHIACRNGNFDIVKLLVERGANLDLQDLLGSTPLHISITNNHKKIANYLINAGADINITYNNNKTPLHLACEIKSKKIINSLIERGSDLNCCDAQVNSQTVPTPIANNERCSSNKEKLIIKNLLENGTDIIKLRGINNFFIDYYDNHNKISELTTGNLSSQERLELTSPKKIINKIFEYSLLQNTPMFDRQNTLKTFFDDMSKDQKSAFIKEIVFNNNVFDDQEFLKILNYSFENNLFDKKGRSVLLSSFIFEKNKNIPFNLLLNEYEKNDYTNTDASNDELIKQLNEIWDYTRLKNRKLHHTLINMDLILHTLKNENLSKIMGENRLEPEIANNILRFIGFNGIFNDRVYYKKYREFNTVKKNISKRVYKK